MSNVEPIKLEDVLAGIVQQHGIPDGLVTGWVIIAEVMESGSGDMSLLTITDPAHPYWHHRGMLEHAVLPSEAPEDEDE